MRLKVLGSSGAEFPGFHPPAFLLDDTLLLDAGTIGAVLPDKAQWKIRHILLTHAHLDHIRGIPFLADNITIENMKHSVTVMGMPQVLRTFKKNLLNNAVWPDFTAIPNKKNAVIKLKPIQLRKPFTINRHTVTAYRVNHSVPASGYVVEDGKGSRLLYTGDTGPSEDIWKAANRPITCAIVEVSMPNSMRKMAILTGHLTASLLKKELHKMEHIPETVLVTHPKPQYLKRIKDEIRKLRMNNIKTLKDGEAYRF
jgi:ribonuclease BN (tRNA processing enzyme)